MTYKKSTPHIEYQEAIDAWYTIASLKFCVGDESGQAQAYAEIDKLYEKLNSLVDPLQDAPVEDEDELSLAKKLKS